MQRVDLLSNVWHTIPCTVIAFMLGYIIYEKKGDMNAPLCSMLQHNIDRSNILMQTHNKDLAIQIKASVDCYPTPISIKYANKLDTLQSLKDSLLHFLDVAKASTHNEDLISIQQAYKLYLASVKSYIDYNIPLVEALNGLAFNDPDSFALWPQSRENRSLIISLIQNNIHLSSTIFLNYFASKCALGDMKFDKFILSVSITNLNFTAPEDNYIEGDVALSRTSGCGTGSGINYKLFINDEEHPINPYEGTTFRKVYERAGTYPIHVKTESFDCMSDSVFASEKTYYIRVK